jgi:hypothetical protein
MADSREYPLCFEDIKIGDHCVYQPIVITQNLVNKHVELYGEDWPEEILEEITNQERRIVPSPLVVSLIAGQGGRINWLKIAAHKNHNLKTKLPIYVGDRIITYSKVTDIIPHKNSDKPYGYVSIHQDILCKSPITQKILTAYERDVKYAILKRNFSLSDLFKET